MLPQRLRMAVPGGIYSPPHLSFDGASSSIACGSGSTLDNLHQSTLTVEAWVKADSVGELNRGTIVLISGGGTRGWVFGYSNSYLSGTVYYSTTNAFSRCVFTPDSSWHHVAMTWDPSTYNYPKLWIDGTEQSYNSTTTKSGTISDANLDSCYIGNNLAGNATWDGGLAVVRLSNTIRYTGSFTPYSQDSPPAADGNTVEQWNLDEGSGTTATAEVTSANDGTISNCTWVDF